MEQIEVSKIVVKIGETEHALTPEQARKLKDVLNRLFGEKDVVYIPTYVPSIRYPYPDPYQPYVTWCATNVSLSI